MILADAEGGRLRVGHAATDLEVEPARIQVRVTVAVGPPEAGTGEVQGRERRTGPSRTVFVSFGPSAIGWENAISPGERTPFSTPLTGAPEWFCASTWTETSACEGSGTSVRIHGSTSDTSPVWVSRTLRWMPMLYPATGGIQSHPQLQINDGLVLLASLLLLLLPGEVIQHGQRVRCPRSDQPRHVEPAALHEAVEGAEIFAVEVNVGVLVHAVEFEPGVARRRKPRGS